MEKYATFNYYKNSDTKEIKKIALHEETESLEKTGTREVWIKITNEKELEKIENQDNRKI